MEEFGFYHPLSGYFQVIGGSPEPSDFDEGTVSVPLKPGADYEWDGTQWVHSPAPVRPVSSSNVDTERDKRISDGFIFNGVKYQSRPEDRENIAGASTAALAAIMNGAETGDYRWHGGDSDFAWIAEDNSTHRMDAHTMFAFGQAAMAHKQAHIFAARSLKDVDPIPSDYTDDAYWPYVG